jgi:hypothetical protein
LQITGEYKLQIEVHTNYGIVNLAWCLIKSHFQDKLSSCEKLTTEQAYLTYKVQKAAKLNPRLNG